MILPTPMNTNRVQEALTAVADYVAFAREIAANVQPISLITPVVKPVVVHQSPQAKKVEIDLSGKTYTVKGKHLDKVKFFELNSAETLIRVISGNVDPQSQTDTSVQFTLTNPLTDAGSYEAWVIDDQGHGDFVYFDINTPIAPGPKPSNASYIIAAVVPDEAVVHCEQGNLRPEKVFVEVISAGDRFPDEIYFESSDGIASCETAISTGNPKVLIIPILINMKKALKHPTFVEHISALLSGGRHISAIDVIIYVKSNAKAKIETQFKFNFLLL